jgi:predicted 3-demethylubiquinone-9 3-methyltransferase (glyoxalase superfamily)
VSAKFLEGVGGKLAEQWVATLLTPAFVFWAGGAAIALQRFGWTTLSTGFSQRPEPLQIAILIVGFCAIAASAFVVQRFDLAVLRFLEGYWHPWLRPLRRWRISKYRKQSDKDSDRWQTLHRFQLESQEFVNLEAASLPDSQRDTAIAWILQWQNQAQFNPIQSSQTRFQKQLNTLTQRLPKLSESKLKKLKNDDLAERLHHTIADLQTERAAIDWRQHHLPLSGQLMPTRLGNILRAAEQRPREKYGLDAIICWSRLWLLLPDAVKKDIQEARADLNTAARVWLWSLLFCLWIFGSVPLPPTWPGTLWSLWPLLGLFSAWFAYGWAIAAATTYGELIEAAFDLYRHLLYQSIRWNLPADPVAERQDGLKLTEYLWRG